MRGQLSKLIPAMLGGRPVHVEAPQHGIEQAEEPLGPEEADDAEAEHREGELHQQVDDGPPAGAVTQGRTQPAEETRGRPEGFGCGDLHPQHAAGEAAVHDAEPARAEHAQSDERQPDEGERQGHSEGRARDGEEEPGDGERHPDEDVEDLGPRPALDGCAQDCGRPSAMRGGPEQFAGHRVILHGSGPGTHASRRWSR